MKALVLLEWQGSGLSVSSAACLAAARECCDTVDAVLIGPSTCTALIPVERLFLQALDPTLQQAATAEYVTQVLLDITKQNDYAYVMAPASSYGKDVLPRFAAKKDMAMLSDVTKILSPNTFQRPIYAGNALRTLRLEEPVKILSIRGTAFPPVPLERAPQEVVALHVPYASKTTVTALDATLSTRPDLSAASIVVSGGRGLKSKEQFILIEQLADALGAAVGASRAAVDAGFISNDHQVGQTGKIVAPSLYIAVGISGAVQHLAGMKDSKIIVAINQDPDAPIFKIASYGLVGDLFKLVPELMATLQGSN